MPGVESPARVAVEAIEHETKLRDAGAPAYKASQPMMEATMKTKSKKKAASSKARSKAKTSAPKGGVRPGSKLKIVVGMLQRPEGCLSADVLKATGWPSVSMPQQAKAAGITLATEKDGVTRYWDAATKPRKTPHSLDAPAS